MGITHHKMDQKKKKNKSSKKILITAGPTREPLDPIRYITNHSSGTLGYKIAEKTAKAGYHVTVISGPVVIPSPRGIRVIRVETAREMGRKVREHIKKNDCIIMAAAVCDFRPVKKAGQKIKKRKALNLRLIKNPDILAGIRDVKNIKKIGFALETKNPVKNGMKKLKNKKLDLIIVNARTRKSNPFGPGNEKRDYTLISAKGALRNIRKKTKTEMAVIIRDEIKKLI